MQKVTGCDFSFPTYTYALVCLPPHPIQQGTPFCALLSTTQDSTPWCFHFWKMHTLEKVSFSAQAGQQGAGHKQQSEQLVMAAPVLLPAIGQE